VRPETKNEQVRVLAICGSLKKTSTTRKALRIAIEGARLAGAEVTLADLSFYELAFCTGSKAAESKGRDFPRLREEIRAAQGLLIATPEYHGSFSGVLKNALDLHDIEDFQGKVVGLVATAGGRQGAHGALIGLRGVFKALKAFVLPHDASLADSHKAFAEDGSAVDTAFHNRLLDVGREVARFSALHSGTFLLADHDLATAGDPAPALPKIQIESSL
jgi:NAD(P)H-dependent FMN reductase